MATMLLADFGADVVKLEHPSRPDPARGHGPAKDGAGLWFKALSRNKRHATLDLSHPDGQELFLRLAAGADVVVENFRPGTLERWNVGWDELSAANPGLVLARVSGFGQDGPYAHRAGFGTLAEAMSGFAALNGEPDGPPLLPPLALADGVAALATAFAILAALRARETNGRGQVVDVSLLEPLMTLLGPGVSAYDALGELQPRTGNRSSHNAPRNVYRTADDRWVAVSSSATSIAERVMRLVGRADLVDAAVVRDRLGTGRRTSRRSTRPSPRGSASGRATTSSRPSRRPTRRPRRSTTRRTSSPTRTSRHEGRSRPSTTPTSARSVFRACSPA